MSRRPVCQEHREGLSIIELSGDEYTEAMMASSTAGVVGSGIYNAMLAHCAFKAKAEIICTWNARHYHLCGAEVTRPGRTP